MSIRSPHADVDIPDVPLSQFVLGRAAELGDRPALVDVPTGRTLTFAEVGDLARRAAGGLRARGLATGDVVAVYMPNIPEYAVAFHATTLAGGTVTTINPVYNTEEVQFQLRDARARFLITIGAALERATEAARGTDVQEIFVVGDEAGDATPITELLASEPVGDVGVAHIAALPYSSGTTGYPKGVMLTQRNLVANLVQVESLMPVSSDDVLIGVLPFFHIYGMTVILNFGLRGGAKVVTMPRFDLPQFLAAIQEHEVTRAYVVPPIALALAKHPLVDEYDLSSLQLIFSGAAPLGAELEAAVSQRLGCRVSQGYGMTESSPVTHGVALDLPLKPGTIGTPLASTECRVVDVETGEDQPAGERGELWLRGPQVMAGYLSNDEATRETVDDDGWLHTGDVAIYDEDRYFSIVDRVKELIKYKGFQVAPAELEAILQTHPAVGDAAVVPVPDEEAGELPKAFIVLSGEATEDEIKRFVAERVSTYKQVRQVEFIDAIPKSASGKILRRVLVDRDREAAAG